MKRYDLVNRTLPMMCLWLAFGILFMAFSFPFQIILGFYAISLGITLLFEGLKNRSHAFLILTLILLVCGMIGFGVIRNGINLLYDLIVRIYEQNADYTFELSGLDIPEETQNLQMIITLLYLYAWLYSMTRICYDHLHYFAVFMLTMLPFFPTLLYSTPQPWLFTLPLLAVWCSLLLSGFTAQRTKKQRTSLVCFLLPLIIMGSTFLILPESTFSMRSDSYQIRAYLLNRLDTFFYDLTHQGEEQGEVDLGRAGDRFYSGAIHLKIETDVPRQMYLKSYSGAVYEDNRWTQLPDSSYQRIKQSELTSSFTWFKDKIYETNRLDSTQKWMVESGEANVSIQDQRPNSEYALLPYFTKSSELRLTPHYDSFLQVDGSENSYVVWDADQVWQSLSDWNRKPSDYASFVVQNYTQVPDDFSELMKRQDPDFLKKLLNAGSHESAVNTIRRYLSERTEYTLTPGRTPNGEDFVEYFLMQKQRGYCVHYATTATLMLRYLGVPARYAEGYIVNSTDFNENMAEIPDRNAHAWVEVFIEERGWIPFEVTPAYSGYDSSLKEGDKETMQPQENNTQTPSDTKAQQIEEEKKAAASKEANNQSEQSSGVSSSLLKRILAVAIMILSVLLVIGQRRWRIKARRTRCLQKDTRKGVLSSILYMEEVAVEWDTLTEPVRMICDKAMYSLHTITRKEEQLVYAYARKRAVEKAAQMKLPARFIYRYLKAMA